MRERAVALHYQDVEELPRILATGAGEIARQIIRIAQQHGIPVQRDDELTELLSKLDPGGVISPESYRLVAEVICFLYYTDREWQKAHRQLAPAIEIGLPVEGTSEASENL